MAAAVLRAEATAASCDRRLHVIGVTWSDDAAAEAALLVESLTAAGFDNAVPVRLVEAAETLARGLVSVIGYDKTVGCVLERESATAVMVDSCDGETRTAVKHVPGGAYGLIRWLAKMFDRSSWQLEGVVVVGGDADLEAISLQLDDTLPVPVFTESGAELALARGAALASARGGGFTDAQVDDSLGNPGAERQSSRPMSHAGALTVLVAAAVTFVGSLSLIVGLRLAPNKELRQLERLVHASAGPRIAEAPLPSPAAVPAPASVQEPPPARSPGGLSEQPAPGPPVAAPPPTPGAPPAQEPIHAPAAAAPEPNNTHF